MSLHDTDVGVRPPTRGVRWVPATRLGRWGIGLGALGFALMPAWMLFGPLGAFPQFGLMAAGGVLSLVAIIRLRERAVLSFAGLLPLLLVIVFLVGELAAPH